MLKVQERNRFRLRQFVFALAIAGLVFGSTSPLFGGQFALIAASTLVLGGLGVREAVHRGYLPASWLRRARAQAFGVLSWERIRFGTSMERPAGWGSTVGSAVVAILLVAVGVIAGAGTGRQVQLTSPTTHSQVQTIRLVAADGGPARGTARIQQTATGRAVDLTVQGLQTPAPNKFYVCWLVGNGDSLAHQNRVSVGSFTVRGRGEVTLRWETAADPARYPNLGITLEPDDGNPLRRGPKVMQAVR